MRWSLTIKHLLSKSMDWFLYHNGLRRGRVNIVERYSGLKPEKMEFDNSLTINRNILHPNWHLPAQS